MSDRCIRALCIAMAFLFPASMMMAETKAAMVMATGVASLNGVALERSTAVFAGDRLETAKNSGAIIHATGSTIQVGANSSIQFEGDAVSLGNGSAQINTSKGLKVKADTVTVQPSKGSAKFQVSRAQDVVTISALTGEVTVINGSEASTLQEGSTTTVDDKDTKKKRRRAAGAVIGPSNARLLTYAAVAVGAGAGISWWLLQDSRKPVSNQLP